MLEQCIHSTRAALCMHIKKYGSTLYIEMDEVFQHHAHTFEKSDLICMCVCVCVCMYVCMYVCYPYNTTHLAIIPGPM